MQTTRFSARAGLGGNNVRGMRGTGARGLLLAAPRARTRCVSDVEIAALVAEQPTFRLLSLLEDDYISIVARYKVFT